MLGAGKCSEIDQIEPTTTGHAPAANAADAANRAIRRSSIEIVIPGSACGIKETEGLVLPN